MERVEKIERVEDIQFMPHPIMPNEDMVIIGVDRNALEVALKCYDTTKLKVAVYKRGIFMSDNPRRFVEYTNQVDYCDGRHIDHITLFDSTGTYGKEAKELVIKSAILHRVEVLVLDEKADRDFREILNKYKAFREVVFTKEKL